MAKALGKAGAADLLSEYRQELQHVQPFEAAEFDRLTHDFVQAREIKIGDIIHAIRVATTGKSIGFGLFDILAILGRDEVVRRIDATLRCAVKS